MNRQVRITPSDSFKARFTATEFLRMAEMGAFDDMKMELVDGELERMNPPMGGHSSRQAMVIGTLWPIARAAGLALLGEVGLDMGDALVLACDAALLRRPVTERRLVDPTETLLVIEIAETTIERDLGMKRGAYARAGVPHYWVVDGARSIVHVFADPQDGEFRIHGAIGFGEPLAVPGTDATIVID
jgi:Uma2 family endonuclease